MIAKLKGYIDSVSHDGVILDVKGVGYHIFASSQTLHHLSTITEETALLIETHVREDFIHLYGFMTMEEKEWFKKLHSVQGIGGRMALAILSSLSLNHLIEALAGEDKKKLTQADGVGPKVASRLITELKEKAQKFLNMRDPLEKSSSSLPSYQPSSLIQEEAISALVHLGYNQNQVVAVLNKLTHTDPQLSLEQLIRLSLKELSKI